jgi:exonuclease III
MPNESDQQDSSQRSTAGVSQRCLNPALLDDLMEDGQGQNPQTPPAPTNTPDTTPHRQNHRKKTKATIKVASFNMHGREMEKWYHLNQLMRDNKIGILALQEAHLTEQHTDHLHSLFHKRIKIFHSSDPNTPNAKGVAIVLNKELTNTKEVTLHEVIPGRALLLETKWHAEQNLSILAIYAPNVPAENRDFWISLRNVWQTQNLNKPDVLLGDFNLVEDSLNRLPSHSDNREATEALQDL